MHEGTSRWVVAMSDQSPRPQPPPAAGHNEPSPEDKKLTAEAKKLRAETRQLERWLIAKPSFWASLVPMVAVVASVYAGYATNFFEVQADKVEAKRDRLAADTARLEIEKEQVEERTRELRAENARLKRRLEVARAAVYIENIIDQTVNSDRLVDDEGRLIAEVQENAQSEAVVQSVRAAITRSESLALKAKFYRVLIIGTGDQTLLREFEAFVKEVATDRARMESPDLWRALSPVEWDTLLRDVAELSIELVTTYRGQVEVERQFLEVVASLDAASQGNTDYLKHHECIRFLHSHEQRADLEAMAVEIVADASVSTGWRVSALWALAVLNPKKFIVAASQIVALQPSGSWTSILDFGLEQARTVLAQVAFESEMAEDLPTIAELPQWVAAHGNDLAGAGPGVRWDAASFR